MDKRQKTERKRADGSGMFSPRSNATPLRSSLRKSKAHRVCAFAVLALAIPLSALAEDKGTTTTVVLDVAKSGSLGAVCTAIIFWLNNQRKARAEAQALPPPPPPERNPPLGEDVARTYVTKNELVVCQGICRKDIDDIRKKIDDNDHAAEIRAAKTHRRIDEVLVCLQKTNRGNGMLIGILVGKGLAPSSLATSINEEG